MIEADTPNLWEIRSHTDHSTAIGIIVIALIHTARLVNVENNLNETQIGEIANDVLEEYGYLKVEELKYLLKTAVRTQKIFGRLDYNVVIGWFADYDNHRTEEAIRISEQKESEERNSQGVSEGAISFSEYLNKLEVAASEGDTNAQARLDEINSPASLPKTLSPEEKHQKELDFKQFYYNYLKKKK